ncbi:PTS sugar transporter subunit IIA [Neisseria sp. WLZKY-1]|uniref:PTS sugar transporter subunit IIA n=1 Tax=Neisseria sp. WLZKY-1 TaxID=3390377 RepID=UPI003978D88C
MIGIVIVTHQALGRAYTELAGHFFPEIPAHIRLLGVEPDEDHEDVIARLQRELADTAAPHGTLVLADIFGATPCNAARRLVVPQKVAILTGLNAPMLVKAVQYSAAAEDLAAFTEAVREAAVSGIIALTAAPE